MPLSDGNPFVLARLAPGVAYHGDLKFSRPFDNGGTSDFTADGGPGRNEFTLDGSPNMANGRRVAFVPPAGAVQEFKVETATFDAQQGHTAGATVNVTLKSGYECVQGRRLLSLSRRGIVRERLLPRARRPAQGRHRYKRYGFTSGRTGHQGTARSSSARSSGSTTRSPNRDSSRSRPKRSAAAISRHCSPNIVIYDPLTAVRRADGRVQRQPFPGNIIPQSPRPDCARVPSSTTRCPTRRAPPRASTITSAPTRAATTSTR